MSHLRPERFVAGGEALGHDEEGRVVFIRGGIPGDEVAVETVETKGEWSRAVVTEVITPSPDRVPSPCARRLEGCGGCDWQELDVPKQLLAKMEIVRDALRRTGKLPNADVMLGRTVPATAYRTTIRVVGGADGRPSYRKDRSHDLVPASGCIIAHPALQPVLDSMRLTPELEVALRVSEATGEINARWDPRHGDVVGLPESVEVGPTSRLREVVAGHRFRVSASSFFQSGPAAAKLLVDAVKKAAPELKTAKVVVDAYAGVGLFALAAVPESAKVIAIENSKSAVGDAKANLKDRDARIENCQVGQWRPDKDLVVDVVIADPARSGLGKPGVAALAATHAPVFVLVSCDPVALARDAALLVRAGYRHDVTTVLDLVPHTHHVECVTRFVRA